jgi:hypothetical protein
MFDSRSFSTTSFDSTSWWIDVLSQVKKYARQIAVTTVAAAVYLFTKPDDVGVKKRV